MVVFAAVGGISTAIVDMTVEDEKEKRAIKASIWAGVAVAGAATGVDSSSAVVGAVMASKELAGVVVEDKKTMAILDASAGVVTGVASGNLLEVAKVTGMAAAGAGIGAAADGTDGIASGMQMGAQLGSGSGAAVGLKIAGAGAGAGIAATTSDAKGSEMLAGARMGASVAGVGLSSTIGDKKIESMVRLGGQLGGGGAALALDKSKDKRLSAASLEKGVNAGGGLTSSAYGAGSAVVSELSKDNAAPARPNPEPNSPAADDNESTDAAKSKTGASDETPSGQDKEAPAKKSVEKKIDEFLKFPGNVVGHLAAMGNAIAGPAIDHSLGKQLEETQARLKKGGSSRSEFEAHKAELEFARNVAKIARESAALRMA